MLFEDCSLEAKVLSKRFMEKPTDLTKGGAAT